MQQKIKGNVTLLFNQEKKANQSQSEETIYRNAVMKCGSTSSEDDENLENDCLRNIEDLIISARARSRSRSGPHFDYATENEMGDERENDEEGEFQEEPRPGTSNGKRQGHPTSVMEEVSQEEKIDKMVWDAEKAKANIFSNQGKDIEGLYNYEFTAKMDEDYMVIGAHVDESMQNKIIRGEYIDFGKLIPRDKIVMEEDKRMELIMKNGRAFWTPAGSGEITSITNFHKWEKAFRIYSNIYTRAHPARASELIQYNHVINSIASTYVWDNVYSYDKEFRMHLSRHPSRSWAIILQQAWTMRLRDRIKNDHLYGSSNNQNFGGNRGGNRGGSEPCR